MSRMLRAAVCALLMMVSAPAAFAQLPQHPQDVLGQAIQVEDILDTTGALAPVASHLPPGVRLPPRRPPAGRGGHLRRPVLDLVGAAAGRPRGRRQLLRLGEQVQQDFTADRDILASAVADAVKGQARACRPRRARPPCWPGSPRARSCAGAPRASTACCRSWPRPRTEPWAARTCWSFRRGSGVATPTIPSAPTPSWPRRTSASPSASAFSGSSESVLVKKYLADREHL